MKTLILLLLISYVIAIDFKSRLLKKLVESEIESYIYGGRDATDGEAPWMVAIQNNDKPTALCGGVRVGDQWVVTAASLCTTGDFATYKTNFSIKLLYLLNLIFDFVEDCKFGTIH